MVSITEYDSLKPPRTLQGQLEDRQGWPKQPVRAGPFGFLFYGPHVGSSLHIPSFKYVNTINLAKILFKQHGLIRFLRCAFPPFDVIYPDF